MPSTDATRYSNMVTNNNKNLQEKSNIVMESKSRSNNNNNKKLVVDVLGTRCMQTLWKERERMSVARGRMHHRLWGKSTGCICFRRFFGNKSIRWPFLSLNRRDIRESWLFWDPNSGHTYDTSSSSLIARWRCK
jgi:hypothetical protein